ncbi:nicotinate-nucleotide--dimethylbenzimidazole phosphoribosyltransferase [Vibrio sp. RC27]
MLDRKFQAQIQTKIDQKTKPLGALGQLEVVAAQLATIQSQGKEALVDTIEIVKPTAVVFAGDHGVAEEGVSIAPSAVTQQMVINFLNGGAGINCFCRSNNVELYVVDAGILLPVELEHQNFVQQRLGDRTNNFAVEPAMTIDIARQGIEYGKQFVGSLITNGSNLVMFGEMGIGNTSSAAAIVSILSGQDVSKCVGMGTGITPEQYTKKCQLVAQGVSRCNSQDPIKVLAEVGGYEIAQLVGGFLAASENGVPVIVDGFIVTAAAYIAMRIDPACRDYMIFAHQSEEQGHQIVLDEMNAKPLLQLGLRLGEGTGAVLAVPLLRCAAEFYNTMASFAEAGVEV